MRIRLLALLSALLWLPAFAARDLPDDAPPVAKQRYRAGLQAYRVGDFEGAAREFYVARTLMPGEPRLSFNLARSLERAGHVQQAIAAYRQYLELAPQAADRREVVGVIESLGALLAAQDAQLTVSSSPPGAKVFVDGSAEATGETPLVLRLTAGEHTLRVTHRANEQRRTVTVTKGARQSVAVQFASDPVAEPARPAEWRSAAGWSAAGLAVAAVGVGAAFTVMAADTAAEGAQPAPDDADRQQRLRDELASEQAGMWAGYGVGVLLGGLGAALLLDDGEPSPGGVKVRF